METCGCIAMWSGEVCRNPATRQISGVFICGRHLAMLKKTGRVKIKNIGVLVKDGGFYKLKTRRE